MDLFPFEHVHIEPICSMHVIFTHIMWHKFILNVGKCSIHGAFGIYLSSLFLFDFVEIWAIFVQMLVPTVATSSVCCFA